MRWLIDGYNVIRRDPDLAGAETAGLEAGRAALLRLVARAARQSGDDFLVVFDGARPRGGAPASGQVGVLFSRPPERADDVLIRLAAQHRAGAVVVSSDRTVHDAAARAGATAVSAEAFVDAVLAGADEETEAPERAGGRRGNPRRASREARAAASALRRLRGR